MEHKLFMLLQCFADGGEGGAGDGAAAEGGNSAVNPGDDGRARLLALGVPESMLRPGRNYSGKKQTESAPAGAAQGNAESGEQMQAAAANETTPKGDKLSFDELLKQNPEYKADVEQMMRQRVRKSRQAETDLEAVMPYLQKYRQDNGLDPNLDVQSTVNHMMGAYSEKAMQLGVSEKDVMEMDIKQRQEQEQLFADHFAGLQSQAAEFQKIMPGFDLMQALDDPKFAQWTSPAVGMTIEQAYRALHGDEMNAALMQATAQKTGEMYANAIMSGSRRPVENGANAQSPSNLNARSYRDMSPAERIAFKRARGLPV